MKRFIIYEKFKDGEQFEAVIDIDKIDDVVKKLKERAGRKDVLSYFVLDTLKAAILDAGKLERHLKGK